MAEVRIAAEIRTKFGKGAARRVRRADKVPGVVYGHGNDPTHVTLPGHELMRALRTPNVLLQLEIDGDRTLTLPKAVQRDPIKGLLKHVDLVIVRRGEKVSVEVPVHTVGEVAPDGLLDQTLITLTVLAEATSIPTRFEVDVEGMEVGSAVHAKDVQLPEGVTLDLDEELLVLHVLAAPTAEQLEAELAEAEAEAGIEHDLPDAEVEAAAAAEAAADGDGESAAAEDSSTPSAES